MKKKELSEKKVILSRVIYKNDICNISKQKTILDRHRRNIQWLASRESLLSLYSQLISSKNIDPNKKVATLNLDELQIFIDNCSNLEPMDVDKIRDLKREIKKLKEENKALTLVEPITARIEYSEGISLDELVKKCPDLKKWTLGARRRVKTTRSNGRSGSRWEDAKEFMNRVLSEANITKTVYITDIRTIDPLLSDSLYQSAKKAGVKVSDWYPTKVKYNFGNIEDISEERYKEAQALVSFVERNRRKVINELDK